MLRVPWKNDHKTTLQIKQLKYLWKYYLFFYNEIFLCKIILHCIHNGIFYSNIFLVVLAIGNTRLFYCDCFWFFVLNFALENQRNHACNWRLFHSIVVHKNAKDSYGFCFQADYVLVYDGFYILAIKSC